MLQVDTVVNLLKILVLIIVAIHIIILIYFVFNVNRIAFTRLLLVGKYFITKKC
jgi:hypothetical protein